MSCVSPGPHTRCGRTATTENSSASAAERQQLSPPPCSASSCRAPIGIGRTGGQRRPATCPSARPTATRRTRIVRRRPREPRRARSRYRRCWSPANSDHGPTTVTFAAAWITTSAPATAAVDRPVDRRRRRAPRARPIRSAGAGTRSRRRRALAVAARPLPPSKLVAPVTRTFTACASVRRRAPRSPTCSTRVRSIFELWRLSTGNAGTTKTAATSTHATARDPFRQRARARGRAGGGRSVGNDDHDDLLRSGRPDPDRGGVIDPGHRLDGLLDPDRCHRPVGGRDDVDHAALDPQPTLAVEVADVAAAVPVRAAARSRAA